MIYRWNIFELWWGAFMSLPLYYLIGRLAFLAATMTGLLWAIGGAGTPTVRRCLVPFVACVLIWVFELFPQIWLIYPILVILISMGYGEKSWLWCLYYRRAGHKRADYLTRMTIAILYWGTIGAALLIIPH